MGFRDETVALRQQRDLLAREVHALEQDRARLRDEIAERKREVEARVAAGVAGAGIWPAVGIGVVASVIALGPLLPSEPEGDSTMFGRVRAVSGESPVAAGAPCTVVLDFLDRKNDSTSSRLEVVCAGRIVYGGGDVGHLPCEYDDDDVVVSCRDPDFTADGGDPRLALDRAARTIFVEERSPRWSVQIDLTIVPGREDT